MFGSRARCAGGRREIPPAVVAGALVALASAAGADVIYVGVGGAPAGCHRETIDEALQLAKESAEDDEIRITRNQVYGEVELQLIDWNSALTGDVTLSGGWDDCLDSVPSGRTTLVGIGTAGVVVAMGAAGAPQPFELTLRDLEITGGREALGSFGETRLHLERSWVHGNGQGGRVSQGARIYVDAATVVEENVGGALGGGFSCALAGSRLVVAGSVRHNEAEMSGGGIFAFGGCVVELRAGASIEGNSAENGGGIVLAEGSWAEGGGAGLLPVRIAFNSATMMGGGILVSGPAPRTLLGNVQIESNEAEAGGGVYAQGDVVVQLERFNFEACARPARCVTLSHNRALATGNALGSAALATDGAEFRMMQGYIEGNSGEGVTDAVLAAYGASMVLDGVQVFDNETDAIFLANSSASVVAGFITAAANSFFDEESATVVDSQGASAIFESSIEIYTSILADHGPFEATFGSTIVGDCLMVDTEEGIEAEVTMVGVDPRFRDAATGDLHLRPESPAIDSCDAVVYAPLDIDFDLDPRGFDSPTRPNVLGPYDRGADESPLLFADGFESGGYSNWSAHFPPP